MIQTTVDLGQGIAGEEYVIVVKGAPCRLKTAAQLIHGKLLELQSEYVASDWGRAAMKTKPCGCPEVDQNAR
jgi:hypothetical protein